MGSNSARAGRQTQQAQSRREVWRRTSLLLPDTRLPTRVQVWVHSPTSGVTASGDGPVVEARGHGACRIEAAGHTGEHHSPGRGVEAHSCLTCIVRHSVFFAASRLCAAVAPTSRRARWQTSCAAWRSLPLLRLQRRLCSALKVRDTPSMQSGLAFALLQRRFRRVTCATAQCRRCLDASAVQLRASLPVKRSFPDPTLGLW